jgi:hypothetical protein
MLNGVQGAAADCTMAALIYKTTLPAGNDPDF